MEEPWGDCMSACGSVSGEVFTFSFIHWAHIPGPGARMVADVGPLDRGCVYESLYENQPVFPGVHAVLPSWKP